MRNIKLILAYDGTAYAGWQRQKKDPTVQGVLEEKLAIMIGAPVTLHGAGRTDAGVHALGMVANFTTSSNIPVDGFYRGLNSLLPADIRVRMAEEVDAGFHARYNAVGKLYLYNITVDTLLMPTERLYRVLINGKFDPKPVKACLKKLIGRLDFSSFEATGSRDVSYEEGRGAVREIFTAELLQEKDSPNKFQFVLAGDGFLRHMVRNIVGTLVEVGQGKRSVAEFATLLAARDRSLAGPTMPANGLFLKEVFY